MGIKTDKSQDRFTFQRMGGIDQIVMENDYDWQNLDKLDPKLWMALSCPIAGLEFNQATLKLLDADGDGRIRAQEVREAVAWVCQRLARPAKLKEGSHSLALADLRDDTPEGQALASALKMAMKDADNKEALTIPEIEKTLAKASDYGFNGDGVITLESVAEAARENAAYASLDEYLRLGMAIVGAKKDASGHPGLDADLAGELDARIRATQDWRAKIKALDLPLGEDTGEAWGLLEQLQPKFEDYFNRCQLAAYAPATASLLDESSLLKQIGAEDAAAPLVLNREALLPLPLAKVNVNCELSLDKDLNPAWKPEIDKFATLFTPLLSGKKKLTQADWKQIWERFAPYATTLNARPSYPAPAEDATRVSFPGLPEMADAAAQDGFGCAWAPLNPDLALEELSDEQLASLLDARTDFTKVVELDLAAPPLASFRDLHKLSLYNAYLYTFLMNFVSFMDFYNPEKKAIFQTGTLYLNSQGCMLTVPVQEIETHAVLAAPSHLCLIYCECARTEADGSTRNMTIASALTQGSLAALLDGRHGLFIDNDGKEWDTRIARIIHNPISIREAVWSPYIRLANMASQQIQKFISKKEEDATQKLTEHATTIAQGQKPAEPKQGFDFAKGAGIFAALGLALSAVSATFAYIANSLASLGWLWPLALVLVFICISGPSVVLAWLKLRQRSLGPLLDASGWAVNKGAPINLAMGASLTSVGKLPPNATCDPHDPYSLPGKMLARKWKIRFWVTIFLLLLACLGAFALYWHFMGEPIWLFDLRAKLGI
ncbi:MAG: ABC transporter permease [Desulfovibrio sp.]|nr:ABC transporter permease [Desulfovibrio sp.]